MSIDIENLANALSKEEFLEYLESAPPHPGAVLYRDFIKPLGLTVYEVGRGMGVHPSILSRIVHGERGVSMDMAYRLALAFDCEPYYWLEMQLKYDIWKISPKYKNLEVKKFYGGES